MSVLGRILAWLLMTQIWSGASASQAIAESQARTKSRGAAPKPDLSVDEARMIVKEISSIDIPSTLGRWKLAEGELVQLRQWSATLVENPGSTDFLQKWSMFVTQVTSRNPQIKEADVTPLIRMVMLAAYEEAQKQADPAGNPGQANAYKELQEQVRSNITQARQLQALLGPERRDPLAGSRLSLPASQRTLRRCDVAGQPAKVECKDVLVSTTYELADYISVSEAQLKKAAEEANKPNVSGGGQEKRLQMLYALSDVAKLMHDAAIAAIRK